MSQFIPHYFFYPPSSSSINVKCPYYCIFQCQKSIICQLVQMKFQVFMKNSSYCAERNCKSRCMFACRSLRSFHNQMVLKSPKRFNLSTFSGVLVVPEGPDLFFHTLPVSINWHPLNNRFSMRNMACRRDIKLFLEFTRKSSSHVYYPTSHLNSMKYQSVLI